MAKRLLLPCVCLILVLRVTLFATTFNVTCSGDITTTLNTDIGLANNGDTIILSAGSCIFTGLSGGLWTDKNITLQGAGKGSTTITTDNGFGQLVSTGSNSPTWHLTGFTLTSTVNTGAITVYANQAASWRGPFHIDHVSFNFPNAGPDGMVQFYGPIYGVLDHDDFVQSFEASILTGLQLNSEDGTMVSDSSLEGAFAASQAYRPGTANNGNYLYIEDCTFTANGATTGGFAAIDTGYTGGRYVVRHSIFTNTALFAHWTSAGNWNSMWWEIYNNNFNWTAGAMSAPPFTMRMQGGGTGLIYNNTIQGNWQGNNIFVITEARQDGQSNAAPPLLGCDGTHTWDNDAGDAAAPGWPCLTQVGRDAGKTIAQIEAQGANRQPSFPLYFWNNGPQVSCYTGAGLPACDNSFVPSGGDLGAYFKSTAHTVTGGGYGQGDVDYCVVASQPTGCGTHTLTYTPFTYPHPLAGGGQPISFKLYRLRSHA